MSLTFPVAPMKATLGSLPRDSESGWAFEVKWDGHRTLAHIDNGSVRLQATAGSDSTARWPELGGLTASLNASTTILDGEMLVLDEDGRPSFDLVQGRDPAHHPAMFHVFDVLQIDGTDTVDLPYLDRRRLLEQVLEPGDHWSVPAHRIGGGSELLAATVEQQLEGLIAKRVDSVYRPGARSKNWRKVKNRRRVEVTIGGFTAGAGNRTGSFGSLLVGVPEPDGLRFAGGVGTGFDQATLDDLLSRLRSLASTTRPFIDDPSDPLPAATWVRPELRATVEIAEFTNRGHVRHASFVGLVDE